MNEVAVRESTDTTGVYALFGRPKIHNSKVDNAFNAIGAALSLMCNSSAHAGYGPSSAQDTGNLDFTTGQLREWRLKSPIYRQLLSKHGIDAAGETSAKPSSAAIDSLKDRLRGQMSFRCPNNRPTCIGSVAGVHDEDRGLLSYILRTSGGTLGSAWTREKANIRDFNTTDCFHACMSSRTRACVPENLTGLTVDKLKPCTDFGSQLWSKGTVCANADCSRKFTADDLKFDGWKQCACRDLALKKSLVPAEQQYLDNAAQLCKQVCVNNDATQSNGVLDWRMNRQTIPKQDGNIYYHMYMRQGGKLYKGHDVVTARTDGNTRDGEYILQNGNKVGRWFQRRTYEQCADLCSSETGFLCTGFNYGGKHQKNCRLQSTGVNTINDFDSFDRNDQFRNVFMEAHQRVSTPDKLFTRCVKQNDTLNFNVDGRCYRYVPKQANIELKQVVSERGDACTQALYCQAPKDSGLHVGAKQACGVGAQLNQECRLDVCSQNDPNCFHRQAMGTCRPLEDAAAECSGIVEADPTACDDHTTRSFTGLRSHATVTGIGLTMANRTVPAVCARSCCQSKGVGVRCQIPTGPYDPRDVSTWSRTTERLLKPGYNNAPVLTDGFRTCGQNITSETGVPGAICLNADCMRMAKDASKYGINIDYDVAARKCLAHAFKPEGCDPQQFRIPLALAKRPITDEFKPLTGKVINGCQKSDMAYSGGNHTRDECRQKCIDNPECKFFSSADTTDTNNPFYKQCNIYTNECGTLVDESSVDWGKHFSFERRERGTCASGGLMEKDDQCYTFVERKTEGAPAGPQREYCRLLLSKRTNMQSSQNEPVGYNKKCLCKYNEVFDATLNECRLRVASDCTNNEQLVNGECVRETVAALPADTVVDETTDLVRKQKVTDCRFFESYSDGVCKPKTTCKEPLVFDNGLCRSRKQSDCGATEQLTEGVCRDRIASDCDQTQTVFKGGVCAACDSDTEVLVPKGGSVQLSYCRPKTAQDCTDAQPVFDSGRCRATQASDCSDEQVLDGNRCRMRVKSDCPDQEMNFIDNKCTLLSKRLCDQRDGVLVPKGVDGATYLDDGALETKLYYGYCKPMQAGFCQTVAGANSGAAADAMRANVEKEKPYMDTVSRVCITDTCKTKFNRLTGKCEACPEPFVPDSNGSCRVIKSKQECKKTEVSYDRTIDVSKPDDPQTLRLTSNLINGLLPNQYDISRFQQITINIKDKDPVTIKSNGYLRDLASVTLARTALARTACAADEYSTDLPSTYAADYTSCTLKHGDKIEVSCANGLAQSGTQAGACSDGSAGTLYDADYDKACLLAAKDRNLKTFSRTENGCFEAQSSASTIADKTEATCVGAKVTPAVPLGCFTAYGTRWVANPPGSIPSGSWQSVPGATGVLKTGAITGATYHFNGNPVTPAQCQAEAKRQGAPYYASARPYTSDGKAQCWTLKSKPTDTPYAQGTCTDGQGVSVHPTEDLREPYVRNYSVREVKHNKCTPLTPCKMDEYESTPPTMRDGDAVSDRVCSKLKTCGENQLEVKPATATTDRVCKRIESAAEYVQYIAQKLDGEYNAEKNSIILPADAVVTGIEACTNVYSNVCMTHDVEKPSDKSAFYDVIRPTESITIQRCRARAASDCSSKQMLKDGLCVRRPCTEREVEYMDDNKELACRPMRPDDCTPTQVFHAGLCRTRTALDCEKHQIFENKLCRPMTAADCASGLVFDTTLSVCRAPEITSECPDNHIIKNDLCARAPAITSCPQGFELKNNQCIAVQQQENVESQPETSCDAPNILDKGICRPQTALDCDNLSVFDTDRCRLRRESDCAPNEQLNEALQCVCAPDLVRVNGACVSMKEPTKIAGCLNLASLPSTQYTIRNDGSALVCPAGAKVLEP